MTGEYHALNEKIRTNLSIFAFFAQKGKSVFQEKKQKPAKHAQARQSLNLLGLTAGKEKDGRGDKIRTCDPLNPIQVRYRAAPRPDSPVP